MPVKAIIIDLDGPLSETEDAHRQAFNQTFVEFGLDWHWSQKIYCDLLKTTRGKGRMIAFLTNRGEVANPTKFAEIHKRRTAVYGEMITSGAANLRPGIADLITDAARMGVRVAVATTTSRPNVDWLTEACFGEPAGDVFEVIAAGDEVKRKKKPTSNVFDLAVAGLRLELADCVGQENSRNDLLSCAGAQVRCIVSSGAYTLGSDFSEAAAVIDCFTDIDSVANLNKVLEN